MSLPQVVLSLAKFEKESLQFHEISLELLITLKKYLKDFNDSFDNNITSNWDERCQIAPFILSSLLRLLNRAVSAEECKIYNTRLAITCTECLYRLIDFTVKNLNDNGKASAFATLLINDDKICSLISNIMLLVIAIMEALKVENFQSSSDYEILALQSFCFYKLVLKCWIYHSNFIQKLDKHSFPQVVTGPCLAQLIQSSLFFSRHSNKSLAEEALNALLASMKYTKSIEEDWRSYFPGTFSGLHTLCLVGQKRGSSVLSITLECLIALIDTIADDRIYQKDTTIVSQELSESASYNFNQIKNLAKNFKLQNSSSVSSSINNLNLPIILDSTKMQEWRVDILQRIGKYFPQAFKTVFSSLSPKQRVLSLNSLGSLLFNSRSFLGQTVFSQFMLLFAPAFDDNTLIVREAARTQLSLLKAIDIRTGTWQKTCSFFTEKFIEIIQIDLKTSLSSLSKDSKVQELVSTLIGIGSIVGDDLGIAVKAGGAEFLSKLVNLILPDLDGGSKTQALEARQYYAFHSKENCDTSKKAILGSYYRLPWLSTQDENCKRSIRKLCHMIGKYNTLMDITSLLTGLESSLENQLKRSISSDIGVSSKLIDRILAGWFFVCNGVLGLGRIVKIKNDQPNITIPCSLCGVKTIPRRCTRCFEVSYCSKEHQQQHWVHHKKNCFEAISKKEKTETVDHIETFCDDINSYNENDIFDPEFLLTSPNLMCSVTKDCVNYKSVNNIIRAAMQNIKFYIKWTNNHLHSLAIGRADHSGDLSAVLSQAASPDLLGATNFIMRISLITATCVECIANCIAIVGVNFRESLFEIIYHFLELLCDPYHYPILRQAVHTSLSRIASYLLYENLSDLLLDVLDSIVDMACSSLRSAYQENTSRQESNYDLTIKSGIWRTHFVIDFVLDELGDNVFAEIPCDEKNNKLTTTFALLSDLVADTLTNIDKLATLNFVPKVQISAIIRVMLVLVRRTLPKIDVNSLQLSLSWTSQSYVMKRLYKNQYLINNVIDEENYSAEDPALAVLSKISLSLLEFKNALSILEKEQLDIKNVTNDQFERAHFESESAKGKDASESVEDEDINETANPTPAMKLILDILDRCTYFLAQPILSDKILIIETIASSFLRLSLNKRVLYPAVHKIWPAIINRLKEQARIFVATADIPENNEFKKSRKTEGRSSDLVSFGLSTQPKYSNLIVLDQSIETRQNRTDAHTPIPSIYSQNLLLPPLLDLLMIAAAVCDDFLAIKFQEDIWPQLKMILRHNAFIDWSNLINLEYSSKKINEMTKFSLPVKLKLAILSFVNQIAINPSCSAYVKANAKVILWFLLPYLSSVQVKDVTELAMEVIKSVFRLEPTFGFILIRTIIENQVSFWNDITNDPCINEVLDRKICSIETILRYYRKDNDLLERLKEIIKQNGTTELMEIADADRKWFTLYIKNWSTI